MKQSNQKLSRRKFIQQAGVVTGGSLLMQGLATNLFAAHASAKKIKVNAHLWVYASKYPPKWDSTPDLETVFADLSYAGIDGVEVMDINLRHENSVTNFQNLIKKYNLPVSGTSYHGDMWDATKHQEIEDDARLIISRLSQLNGKTFGISVGQIKTVKTEQQLDVQAEVLKKILTICKENGVEPNLHNHTYEVENNLHDLKGTLARIPGIKLGPDLNWLVRAGVDPVAFINEYGKQIVYMHIRDQYADGNWTEYAGQGVTDFSAIAAALKAQNFKGSAAIELAFEKEYKPVNPLKEDWKLSRQYVKTTFGW